MIKTKKSEICDLCHRGKIMETKEEIAFHQWTDKGRISCRAVIPVGVCDNCESRVWNEETELAIERAVKREYDKLP